MVSGIDLSANRPFEFGLRYFVSIKGLVVIGPSLGYEDLCIQDFKKNDHLLFILKRRDALVFLGLFESHPCCIYVGLCHLELLIGVLHLEANLLAEIVPSLFEPSAAVFPLQFSGTGLSSLEKVPVHPHADGGILVVGKRVIISRELFTLSEILRKRGNTGIIMAARSGLSIPSLLYGGLQSEVFRALSFGYHAEFPKIRDIIGFFIDLRQLHIGLQVEGQKLIQSGAQNGELLLRISLSLNGFGERDVGFEYVVYSGDTLLIICIGVAPLNFETGLVVPCDLEQLRSEKYLEVCFLNVPDEIEAGSSS